jgi:hypothetical protein
MKLHSDVIYHGMVTASLRTAKLAGHIAEDVYFVKLDVSPSRSRKYGLEIQLGAFDKTSGPSRSRRYKNRGNAGADSVYSATWYEWGFFIAELFIIDPDAVFGAYKGIDSFNAQTSNLFVLESA